MAALASGCTKEPEPSNQISMERPYLRKLTVEGAKEVTMDHSARTIQIVLPETYQFDEIQLQMELIDGVTVSSEDPFKTYGFRGFKPIPMNILNTYSQKYDTYTIYVDVEGEMQAHMRENLHLIEDGTCIADVVFDQGIGTVPERPSEAGEMVAWLSDSKNSKLAIKNTGSNLFQFADAYKLVPSETLNLSVVYKEQKLQISQNQKLTEWIVRAAVENLSTWWNIVPKGVDLNIAGGCFLPSKKYQIKLQNYFTEVPIIETEYKGTQKLGFKIPDNVKDGNYYIGVYENNHLISKSIHTVSNDPRTKGIQQVWSDFSKEVTAIALDAGEFKPVFSRAGNEIFVNPYPMFTRIGSGTAVTADQLPVLILVGTATTFEITPQVREDRVFGDAAFVLYYPAYSLPANIPRGKYAIRLRFKDWGVTEPFSKPLEIR